MDFSALVNIDLIIQYASKNFNSIKMPLFLFIGTAFAFFVLRGILSLFKKSKGYE